MKEDTLDISERPRVQHPAGGPLMTRQSDALESDINHIINKWVTHGTVPVAPGSLTYGDFTSALSYHEALNKVIDAQSQFEALPASLRTHVQNDVGNFLDLVYDPARRDELEALGLVPERVPPAAPKPAEPEPEPVE